MAGKTEIVGKLAERAASDDLGGINLSYRLTGGAPGEQLSDDELQISGQGAGFARSGAGGARAQNSVVSIGAPEMRQLLLEISEGLPDLIPSDEARFVPDTVVGRVLINLDGREEQFYFLPDEAQARQHGRPMSAKARRTVAALDRLHHQFLSAGKDDQ